MVLRTLVALSVFCLVSFSGCSHCQKHIGLPAPHPTLCHVPRLVTEIGWLYADINDTFFGIDYYEDLNTEFGPGPYHDGPIH